MQRQILPLWDDIFNFSPLCKKLARRKVLFRREYAAVKILDSLCWQESKTGKIPWVCYRYAAGDYWKAQCAEMMSATRLDQRDISRSGLFMYESRSTSCYALSKSRISLRVISFTSTQTRRIEVAILTIYVTAMSNTSSH